MACCVSTGVASDALNLRNRIASLQRPAAIQPTRAPGASVLENDEHMMTCPWLSNAFSGNGRGPEKLSSP